MPRSSHVAPPGGCALQPSQTANRATDDIGSPQTVAIRSTFHAPTSPPANVTSCGREGVIGFWRKGRFVPARVPEALGPRRRPARWAVRTIVRRRRPPCRRRLRESHSSSSTEAGGQGRQDRRGHLAVAEGQHAAVGVVEVPSIAWTIRRPGLCPVKGFPDRHSRCSRRPAQREHDPVRVAETLGYLRSIGR
jgi:hypothetical protein